ncbi:YT521-B-like splicing factor [Pseudohyphozyma bogoriensis]|nr:YT521-B-like splicing factor [Pseudohyphozyma bogoriensis]
MSTSQTQLAPAPSHYTYTLPFTPPIPFPVNPSYPIQLPSLPPLKSAYTFALYSPLAPKLALATFSSHLLQLREQPRHQSAPEASVGLEGTIRELLLPIHDFDHKYRAAVPAVWDPPAPAPSPPLPASLKEDEEELSALAGGMKAGGGAAKEKDKGRKKDKKDGKEKRAIDESEKQDMMAAYKRWLVAREEKEKAKKGKGKAGAEAVAGVVLEGAGAGDEAGGWTVKTDLLQEWITELELIETLLQSLLLLTLLSASSLPQSLASSPPPPVPKKKSKNPERHSSTLDPEMLLDFLTDRIQIWRVMKDVGNIDVAVTGGTSSKTDGEGEEEEEKGAGEKDLVQEWWDSIVEPLFSPHLPPSLLPLHRRKLFPALSTSTTDALSETLSTRLVPAPSPFKVKDRSLLSLDRSARRRGAEEEKGKIAESPTMKRLMGFKGLKVGARKEGKDLLAGKVGEDAGEEVFKVPSMGMGRKKAPAVPPTASGSSRSSKHSNINPDALGWVPTAKAQLKPVSKVPERASARLRKISAVQDLTTKLPGSPSEPVAEETESDDDDDARPPPPVPSKSPAKELVRIGLEAELRGKLQELGLELCGAKEEVQRLRLVASKVYDFECERTELRAALDGLAAERDYLRAALMEAQNEVAHHDSELEVLREGLGDHSMEMSDALKAREVAEGELRSQKAVIKVLEMVLGKKVAELDAEVKVAKEENDQLERELEATREDLKKSQEREAAQEESAEALLVAQEELEAAYEDALTQIEEWKRERGLEDPLEAYLEDGSEDEDDDDGGSGGEKDAESTRSAAPNTTLDEYDVIDLQRELDNPSPPPGMHRESSSLKTKLTSLNKNRTKPNDPTSQAVRQFAVKDLEDELAASRMLCEAFAATEPSKLKRLQRLQRQIAETTEVIRVTAVKLKATHASTAPTKSSTGQLAVEAGVRSPALERRRTSEGDLGMGSPSGRNRRELLREMDSRKERDEEQRASKVNHQLGRRASSGDLNVSLIQAVKDAQNGAVSELGLSLEGHVAPSVSPLMAGSAASSPRPSSLATARADQNSRSPPNPPTEPRRHAGGGPPPYRRGPNLSPNPHRDAGGRPFQFPSRQNSNTSTDSVLFPPLSSPQYYQPPPHFQPYSPHAAGPPYLAHPSYGSEQGYYPPSTGSSIQSSPNYPQPHGFPPLASPPGQPYPVDPRYYQHPPSLASPSNRELHPSQFPQYYSPYGHPHGVPMWPSPSSQEQDHSPPNAASDDSGVVYGDDGEPTNGQESVTSHPSPPSHHLHHHHGLPQSLPYPGYGYVPYSSPGAPAYAMYQAGGGPGGAAYAQPMPYPGSSFSASSAGEQPANQGGGRPLSPNVNFGPAGGYGGDGYASSGSTFQPAPPHLANARYQHQHYAQQPPYAYYEQPRPPQPYIPPAEAGLARGQLAQAKFHDAVFDREAGGYHAVPGERRKGSRSALPKPPAHSQWALWVGNVPSDATHTELWQFFISRPVPAVNPTYAHLRPEDVGVDVDLQVTGVESIHLINRSNCAFVNYASDIHLQHSIAVSHGVSLRPFDPRCAQRTGGLHHAFLAKKQAEEKDVGVGGGVRPHRHSTASSGGHSLSTASTTSSFLGRHFPKRFFVLKSHNEDDLQLSVERGVWATQTHNEPVLDQAYRSCTDGVYLFFSANKSGEWFGYGRMTSPISSSLDRRVSWTSRNDDSSGSNPRSDPSSRPAPIPEEQPASFNATRPPILFSPSEERLADKSPLPLTPSGSVIPSTSSATPTKGDSAPAKLPNTRVAQLTSSGEHVGALRAAPRGESLDPKLLADVRGELASLSIEADAAVLDQEAVGGSSGVAEQDDDGVWRKDTIPTAEERNARLEKMDEKTLAEGKPLSTGWGKPFKVEWIKCKRLPFTNTRGILNGFNSNREVKISRDGTEVEPSAGEALIAEFWRDEGGVPPSPKRPQPIPTGLVG